MQAIDMKRLLFGLIVSCVPAAGAPLFESDEVLGLRLEGPLREVMRDRAPEQEERLFTLTVDGEELEVAVRARGRFRRANCNFLPLRLNFKKKAVKGTAFAGQDKLKLVTHCKNSRAYEQNTLEEFNIYRFFNLVTDASFRVRLAKINYVEGDKQTEKFGFLIESQDALSERINGSSEETQKIASHELDPLHATMASIFQFMVGNTDFSFLDAIGEEPCCHNAKLVRVADGRLLSIPYDFDMSGLVNASYATPNPKLSIRTVRQRRYRGFCSSDEILDAALAPFIENRGSFSELLQTTPGIEPKPAARLVKYIGGFFQLIDKNGAAAIKKICRGGSDVWAG